MTDFIITMLMITLLNILLGTVAFILLMMFSRRIDAKKKLKAVKENSVDKINEAIDPINIREYSMSMLNYLPIATIAPPMPIIINANDTFFYTTRKVKRGYNKHGSSIKVNAKYRGAYNRNAVLIVKEYLQNELANEAHVTSPEFHRFAVPCG